MSWVSANQGRSKIRMEPSKDAEPQERTPSERTSSAHSLNRDVNQSRGNTEAPAVVRRRDEAKAWPEVGQVGAEIQSPMRALGIFDRVFVLVVTVHPPAIDPDRLVPNLSSAVSVLGHFCGCEYSHTSGFFPDA